ncbi:hypothetical protein CFOL_v3_17507 [Cephalotus follicularis]|uniref:Exo_endo_phos domain-containing protein n=1 Tax=Cephalotus follicularis TaxID=3775 RepID=A0A1Q3C183_CEPFO|nr:hypothetical protein CFOL_v3_17507 [Cephalotus follicularis]
MWDAQISFVPSFLNERAIHGEVCLPNNVNFFVSFVYGLCDREGRTTLWEDLTFCASQFKHKPRAVLGDFNVIRYGFKHSTSSRVTKAMKDFNNTITMIELEDLSCSGFHFTWSNMRTGVGAVSKKLDRALGNWHWFRTLGDSFAVYHPPGISDHSPVSIQMRNKLPFRGRPFKFLNLWTENENFLKVVRQEWAKNYQASPLMAIHLKLKRLKGLLKAFGTRPDSKAKELRLQLHTLQSEILNEGETPTRVEKERLLKLEVGRMARWEEAYFKQKSRIQWLKDGDSNTAYFHRMVKVRQSKNHIARIKDVAGSWVVTK